MLAAFLLLAFSASMAGGVLPTAEGLLDRLGADRILCLRSGLLIAVALTGALPEAWWESPAAAAAAAAAALALGWFLHRGHAEEHAGHELTHPHIHGAESVHLPTALAALFAHSLIDGLNLGAMSRVGGASLAAVGAATSLHKLADGFTLTSLFHGASTTRRRARAALVAASMMTPLGAILGREGALSLGPIPTGLLLGFAGGSFLYVGAAQIVPHLSRKRDRQSLLSFAGGLGAILVLRLLG